MSIKLTRKNCIFTPRFWKQLLKVGNVERRAIEMKLTAILDENTPANIRKLTDHPYADFRLRIGDYRLFFFRDKAKDLYYFDDCRHRSDAY